MKRIFFGLIFSVLFLSSLYVYFQTKDFEQQTASLASQAASLVFASLAVGVFLPKKKFDIPAVQTQKNAEKLSKRTAVCAGIVLLLIPLTVLFGMYFLEDRKYYFISLLIILEILLPFAYAFENRKPKAREIVIISVLCAIAVAGRAAFFMLPQFKPVAAVVIISAVCLGGEAGFLVGAVTGFVSNFFFSQGPWTPWQMFAFGIIGYLAGVLFAKGILRRTKTELCIFGFLATLLLYGGIMNTSSVLIWQPNPTKEMFLSSYVMGLPFDLIHAASTVFFLWFAGEPLCEKIERVKTKYGLK